MAVGGVDVIAVRRSTAARNVVMALRTALTDANFVDVVVSRAAFSLCCILTK